MAQYRLNGLAMMSKNRDIYGQLSYDLLTFKAIQKSTNVQMLICFEPF